MRRRSELKRLCRAELPSSNAQLKCFRPRLVTNLGGAALVSVPAWRFKRVVRFNSFQRYCGSVVLLPPSVSELLRIVSDLLARIWK